MAKIKKTKIEDLIPDDLNFNKGTQFGQSMIEKSLRTFGAGRSILLDKNNYFNCFSCAFLFHLASHLLQVESLLLGTLFK